MTSRRIGPCTWCLRPDVVTADHVFPAAIGGTRDLSVPACPVCQGRLSTLEQELSRRSIFAAWRNTRDFKVHAKRLRRDPASGSIEASYLIRKDPEDGFYREVAVLGGQPVALPSIQLNVSGHSLSGGDVLGRVDAQEPGDIDRLIDALHKSIDGPPDSSGCIGSLDVQLLDEHDVEIVRDPNFLPRAYLNLAGRPKIRARSGEEAQRFARVLLYLTTQGHFRDHGGWRGGEVKAGTTHRLRLEWDERKVLRVIAKIAYGVAWLKVGPEVTEHDLWPCLRKYVVGEAPEEAQSPVREVHEPGSIKAWPDYHLAGVEPVRDGLRGLVSVYGAFHVVDFDSSHDPLIQEPVVAICRLSGDETRFVDGEDAKAILAILRQAD